MLFKKTLKDYAENLFAIGGHWHQKRKQKGRSIINKTIYNNAYLTRNFIIPFWGDLRPQKISVKIINEKLITAKSAKGLELAYSTKNKILSCLSEIFTYLAEEELVKTNPVKSTVRFSSAIINKRGALSPDEMHKLFPRSHGELLRIWRRQIYICAFLILRDTGLRPNELVALQWKDWHPELKFFPVTKAIEAATRAKIKSTKTGAVKPAIVSPVTAREIMLLKNSRPKILPETFIFAAQDDLPLSVHTLSRNFHCGVRRAGINRPEITPYWLRHTFNTRMLEVLPDEAVRTLMGHRAAYLTEHYRDADVNSLIREARKIHKIIKKNKLF
ncbi:MAG: tyrosine-type recombinase/integrase [Candidatus Margulisbacteria bacterium]|jgi:integrase|nr:tyrosine-type recombinase/integrase [Candidatus Margulisiibacteriota bacterium]